MITIGDYVVSVSYKLDKTTHRKHNKKLLKNKDYLNALVRNTNYITSVSYLMNTIYVTFTTRKLYQIRNRRDVIRRKLKQLLGVK